MVCTLCFKKGLYFFLTRKERLNYAVITNSSTPWNVPGVFLLDFRSNIDYQRLESSGSDSWALMDTAYFHMCFSDHGSGREAIWQMRLWLS